tara:strand:- start:68042 stop:69736 length:1695 start_codon:yes stop_codon:yes gene_type:complete
MSDELIFSPGLWLIFSGILFLSLKQKWRLMLIIMGPTLALLSVWVMPESMSWSFNVFGLDLQPIRNIGLGRLFATVFCLMALMGGIFAYKVANNQELSSAYIYAGSAICITFAGDLITLFVFWELMAIASTVVIWSAGTSKARAAAFRYILIHFFGGMLLLTGIAGHFMSTDSLLIVRMQTDNLSQWLILAGILVNAGAPPISAWIADAYPEASPSGAVFLSAFTTKTAVFVLIVAFPGATILIPVGLFMIFYGIIYALLENDMRRILAYSIVNQVGFMVTAIGIGSEMALNGAAAHAFAHIIYKGLLLMSAGAVLYKTGKRKCTDLGGLFRTMPITALLGTVGAFAISAFPMTSGFTTKSMIPQAAADQGLMVVWFALIAASAGVFLHAGIKFPWFVFFQKDSGLRPSEPPKNMLFAMWILAFICIAIGAYPEPFYNLLSYDVEYKAYTLAHLSSQFQLLLFSGLAFFVLLPLMKRTLTISLDFDWFYRKLFKDIFFHLEGKEKIYETKIIKFLLKKWKIIVADLFFHHGPHGFLAKSWPIGSMAFWVAMVLVSSLLLFFLAS